MNYIKLIFITFLILLTKTSHAQKWTLEDFFSFFGDASQRNENISNCINNNIFECIYINKNKSKLRKFFSEKINKGLLCSTKSIIDNSKIYYNIFIRGKSFFTFTDKEYDIKIVPVQAYYYKKTINISFNMASRPWESSWKLNRETLIAKAESSSPIRKYNCKLQSPIIMLDNLLNDIKKYKKKNKL